MTALHALIEFAGWFAAVSILGAYYLLSAGKLGSSSRLYQWMNVLGAIGFVVNSGWHRAMPSVALNVVWFAIGASALWRNRARPR